MTDTPASTAKGFFGHPRGLATLFFTEMWERFSYYGMRALLILFMTAAIAEHGLGFSKEKAAAIYGLYTFGVYALALPGGWLADRIFGQRRAVLIGGCIIALGHYVLAIPAEWAFFLGLVLVVLGTGLLKPNVSAIVATLYPEGGARRDAGFSIFYMGINLGAFLGPLVCSYLGEKVNWHYGFGAAGVGMTLGLIQYVRGGKHLGEGGRLAPESAAPERIAAAKKSFGIALGIAAVLVLGLVGLATAGIAGLTLVSFAQGTGVLLVVIAILYFAAIIAFACRDIDERKRILVIFFLFLGAAMFWSGFEQAGSSMNLFAEEFTDRVIFGNEIPTGWLQSVNPLFIILLAPVVGGLWVKLGKHNPSIPLKFGLGLLLLGSGFLVIAWGAQFTGAGKVSPMWLVVTYFLHTVAELCLSPVGLSSITKLSPQRLVSQMMGTWFLGAALGNLIAGLAAGFIEKLPHSQLYSVVAAGAGATGLLFVIFARPIRRMAHGID